MARYVIAYVANIILIMALDYAWLSTMGMRLYRSRLGDMLLDKPILWAAAVFYLLYALGVLVFAVLPALRTQSWTEALWLGAFLGLIAYMTYDLTNMATVRNWSILITVLDMAWGIVLTATCATASYFLLRKLT